MLTSIPIKKTVAAPAGFLPKERLAALLDVSAVRANSDVTDVRNVAAFAGKYRCAAAFSLPSFTETLIELLVDFPEVLVGGTVGFPAGGETTLMKVNQAGELLALGCREIDMVLNIGKMLSGDLEYVEKDIAAVKQAVGTVPLKVILECHYFDADQIRSAAECCLRAGADWLKTGTGWAPSPTTLDQIRLLKQVTGNDAQVKASGGIRDLDTLLAMYNAGAERFGIGYRTASLIFDENAQREQRNL